MKQKTTKAVKPKFIELKSEDLRWQCSPEIFDNKLSTSSKPLEQIIGQERALSALKLGVDIDKPGYNIFISGLSGTGKATTVRRMLESIGNSKPHLKDYVYVYNFENPDYPILLTFDAGKAKIFNKDIGTMMNYISDRIPKQMEAEGYRKKRDIIASQFKETEWKLFEVFKKKLQVDGFTLVDEEQEKERTPQIVPIINNEAVPIVQVLEKAEKGEIPAKLKNKLVNKYENYRRKLITVYRDAMIINQKMRDKLDELEQNEAAVVLDSAMSDISKKYTQPKIKKYLTEIRISLLSNLWIFKKEASENVEEKLAAIESYLKCFVINIILDNSHTEKRPVVVEISPTLTNLFGSIERVGDNSGKWSADFTTIKAGSILKANGGYLVIRAVHLFEEPGVWQTLKRALTYNKLEIQEVYVSHFMPPSSMKPEAIDLNTKVIIIGNAYWYSMLAQHEDDFKKIFKVKVDFDSVVQKSEHIITDYANVIRRLIQNEKLLEFDSSALAIIMETAARYAEHKERFTTRFSYLVDIARESDYWARLDTKKIVTAEYVFKALEKSKERHSLSDEKLTEGIIDKQILIETDGSMVGCVNGLIYFEDESYGFGKPARITASVSIGDGDIVNVERESGLSGRIFDKGMLTIIGYIRELFGRHIPLAFNANFVFEQSYGGIDGDSASAAEIFALLSSLGEIPIDQGFAVTGSVNQKGEMQPIGGINEKIEGFFEICEKRGLNGKHGVIIPHQNVAHLMLDYKILKAVEEKKFHVLPIKNVETGMEILTGLEAGTRQKNGRFPVKSIFGMVEHNLKSMYDIANNFDNKKKSSKRK